MFRYKLLTPMGEEIGEATHRFLIEPGEVLTVGSSPRYRVVKIVPVEEQDSEIVALLYVETA